jgi:hypothetical protein
MVIEVIYLTASSVYCIQRSYEEVPCGNNTNGRIQTQKTASSKREKRINPHKEEESKKLDGEADPE